MTLASILDTRYAIWVERLYDHGYELLEPAWGFDPDTTISIRARRAAGLGAPQVGITIVEVWMPGADPRLGLDVEGCFLSGASWNARIDPTLGDDGIERFEVDRELHRDMPLHRHPFGHPNAVKWLETELLEPEQWIQRVENEAFAAF